MPPSSVSLILSICIANLLVFAYIEYIRKRSAPKRAASSPPAPWRISTITFRESLGSLGIRSIFSSPISFSKRSRHSLNSSSAISRNSGSRLESRIISSESLRFFSASLYSLNLNIVGSRFLYSLISLEYSLLLDTTSGRVSICSISLNLSSALFNFSIIISTSISKSIKLYCFTDAETILRMQGMPRR